jgi:hypothetical protein
VLRRIDRFIIALTLLTLVGTLGLQVNPWPRDGWFESQYFVIGSFPGHDNYTPIAAPALLYLAAHGIAVLLGLGLAGEFYVASVLQNLLLLLSAYFVYRTLVLSRMRGVAGPIAVIFLLTALSTRLPQGFYSENTVLFLISAVLLALASTIDEPGASGGKFWIKALVCGLLVGLAVLTRLTPLILIPAITLLLWSRLPRKRSIQFAGSLIAISALLLAGAVLGNHARFGRYELTNSSGRHLWQGVKDFSDAALANSGDYQALKRIDPHIEGKSWWEISPIPPDDYTGPDPREPLLRKLSREAILEAPGLYLLEGVEKFVATVGVGPYLPDKQRGGANPLNRTEFLPSLAILMHVPAAVSGAVEAGFRGVHEAFRRLYVITIFLIVASGIAMLLERLARRDVRRGADRRRARILLITLFVAASAPVALLPVADVGFKLSAIGASVLCLVLLGFFARLLGRTLHDGTGFEPGDARISLFLFSAFVFFGSLWGSWQLEYPGPRYVVPYLSLWSIQLAVSISYWMQQWAALRAGKSDLVAATRCEA